MRTRKQQAETDCSAKPTDGKKLPAGLSRLGCNEIKQTADLQTNMQSRIFEQRERKFPWCIVVKVSKFSKSDWLFFQETHTLAETSFVRFGESYMCISIWDIFCNSAATLQPPFIPLLHCINIPTWNGCRDNTGRNVRNVVFKIKHIIQVGKSEVKRRLLLLEQQNQLKILFTCRSEPLSGNVSACRFPSLQRLKTIAFHSQPEPRVKILRPLKGGRGWSLVRIHHSRSANKDRRQADVEISISKSVLFYKPTWKPRFQQQWREACVRAVDVGGMEGSCVKQCKDDSSMGSSQASVPDNAGWQRQAGRAEPTGSGRTS